ncbi:MAG: hypothetical protein B7Y90_09040 [Alphaproteobacteria bacterium 32-64-14]|nr:MAG: hypothetical protein B7Y90_09040 [Alphaproteobacteria bacterium 32-64-14]
MTFSSLNEALMQSLEEAETLAIRVVPRSHAAASRHATALATATQHAATLAAAMAILISRKPAS